MDSEVHLMIVWEHASEYLSPILLDCAKQFELLQVYEMHWSPEHVLENFSRFYGVKLKDVGQKQQHCGAKAFHLLILRDRSPVYEYRETSESVRRVNTRLFDFKAHWRQRMGGGHRLHASNDTQEARHDLFLLLAQPIETWQLQKASWDGTIRSLHKDLVGATGWQHLEELLAMLNACSEYVVLRNFEQLHAGKLLLEHEDLDLLVASREEVVRLMKAQPVAPKDPTRAAYHVRLGDRLMHVDVRTLGDRYYCSKWQHAILQNRVREFGYYRPNQQDHFYALLYHAFFHKLSLASDYKERLRELAKALNIELLESQDFYSNLYVKLRHFLSEKGYLTCQPLDRTVAFDYRLTDLAEKYEHYFKREYALTSITPIFVDRWKNASGAIFFKATSSHFPQTLFLKCEGLGDSLKREVRLTRQLSEKIPQHAQKMRFYHLNSLYKCVAYEWIDGVNLQDVLKGLKPLPISLKSFLDDLLKILQALHASGWIHRDIRPDNLMITSDGRVVLVDYQFAIQMNKPKSEIGELVQKRLLNTLGGSYAMAPLHWDDAVSMYKVASELCQYVGEEGSEALKQMIALKGLFFLKREKEREYLKK